MLLPGTFLGVWNLISISGRRAADGISPAWIQAHGHAQVLGWIGTFILGIGFYSIPKLRGGLRPFALHVAWFSGALWMAGVLMRWIANVYLWHWRALLPVSAAMELVAFLIFCRAVSRHKPQDSGKAKLETWALGRDCWYSGTARNAGPQPRSLSVACLSSQWTCIPSQLGSALPDTRCLGIHGAFCVGLQRQVATGISRHTPTCDRLLGAAVAVKW